MTKALYAAFDIYPSAKGAATHIGHMFGCLHKIFPESWLFTLGIKGQESDDKHIVFQTEASNYLKRAESFSSGLADFIRQQERLELIHFRDIWGGLAVLKSGVKTPTLFEVNSLPSIELPYRYAQLGTRTLEKIEQLEQLCLNKADFVIAPSLTTVKYLQDYRQVPSEKIALIPNGALIPDPQPVITTEKYILYFGALQQWQGVDMLIKAMNYLQDFQELKLVIASSNPEKAVKPYIKLVHNLQLENRVNWHFQLGKAELSVLIQNAVATVAPLKECSRNLVQGCNPLKILESMAAGTPVIASDLPVVRELINDGITGKLVRPDRPPELARAIRLWLEYPETALKIGTEAREKIKQNYNLSIQKNKLKFIYEKLVTHRKPLFYQWTA